MHSCSSLGTWYLVTHQRNDLFNGLVASSGRSGGYYIVIRIPRCIIIISSSSSWLSPSVPLLLSSFLSVLSIPSLRSLLCYIHLYTHAALYMYYIYRMLRCNLTVISLCLVCPNHTIGLRKYHPTCAIHALTGFMDILRRNGCGTVWKPAEICGWDKSTLGKACTTAERTGTMNVGEWLIDIILLVCVTFKVIPGGHSIKMT